MKENYQYPLDETWTRDEMLAVMDVLQAVEQAYEKGISKELFMEKYEQYKRFFKSQQDEKRLDREFQAVSDYSLYQVKKQALQSKGMIRL